MKPKFTVIVPTRERADVLASSLATVTAQDYDALEILVSDNASQDATRDVVLSIRDPRIRYINTGRRVSMTGNFEFALSHVRDGWIAVLGDDDGLMPRALAAVADLATAAGVDAVRSAFAQFFWPSVPGEPHGRLELPLARGWELRDGRTWLQRVMRGDASYGDLPYLYTGGFVSLALVDRIRRDGRVFGSCIPDVYSALALASVLGPYVYSRTPLALHGVSRHSTGAAYLRPASSPDAAPVHTFRAEETIPMHPDIPYTDRGDYPQSVQALVYECYRQSAWLREEEPDRHQDQLELVLAMIDANAEAISTWAERFAVRHGLDLERARRRAGRRRSLVLLRRLPHRLRLGVTHVIESASVPMRDIHDATLVAAGAFRATPSLRSRARDTLRFVRRQITRLRR